MVGKIKKNNRYFPGIFSVFIGFAFYLLVNPNAHAANFSISNTTPKPAEDITIIGSGLTPNQEYYLYVDGAGTTVSYSDTQYNGEGAKLFDYTQSTNLSNDYPYLSLAYDDIDAIYLEFRYFDSVTAEPLFTTRFTDVYFGNREKGIAHNFPINSLGSNSWKTAVLKLDKSIGVIDTFLFIRNTSDIYLSKINRFPMFAVKTNDFGTFSLTKPAPRRSNNLTADLLFTYKLYNPVDESTTTAGAINLTPIYDSYQTVKDMLLFHYAVVMPETYTQNYGVTFASWQRTLNGASLHGNWAQGYIGQIYHLLGKDDLLLKQADRFIDSQDSSGRYYSSGGVYIDNAIPAYWTLRLAYEKTNDSKYLDSMRASMKYNLTAYNAAYGVAGHADVYPTQFWIDQLTAFPQLAYYLGQADNNATYKQYAINAINYAIDHMQAPAGYFYGVKDFTTGAVETDYWDGGEVWALQGLYEMRNSIDDSSLKTKIDNSLAKLADNLVSRPLADLRQDYQRTSGLAYYLFLLSRDNAFTQSQQSSYRATAEQLFNLALLSMNSRPGYLNQYGLTYTSEDQASGIYSDFFMLRILKDIYPDYIFTPIPHVGGSILSNPSFEINNNGAPYDWTGSSPSAYWDSGEKHSGNASLKITGQSRNDYISQAIRLKPNTQYSYSLWIKTHNITGRGVSAGYTQLAPTTTVFPAKQWIKGTSDWQQITGSFTTPSDYQNGRFDILWNITGGTAWVDDVQIMPGYWMSCPDIYRNKPNKHSLNPKTKCIP